MKPEKPEPLQSETSCQGCAPLTQAMRKAGRDPHKGYDAVIRAAAALTAAGSLELFVGDCPLEEAEEALNSERHYTVCHYLRCRTCGSLYFVGACVRGRPVYRRVEGWRQENLAFRLWGRCGSFFAGNAENAENV